MYLIAAVGVCDKEDIVFVVDSSGSILRQNWPLVLNFMKNIIQGLNIGPDSVQVGVVLFGDDVYPQFQLNTFYNKNDILNQIDRIQYLDQSTNTPAALRYMRSVMFTPQNGDRSYAPNSAIIITDGVPRVPLDINEARRLTLQEASLAKSQGINMFAIGVGPEITQYVLNGIASQPSRDFTFRVNEFRQLNNILNQVASAACGSDMIIEIPEMPILPGKCVSFKINILKYQPIYQIVIYYANSLSVPKAQD